MTEYECCKTCAYDPRYCLSLKDGTRCGLVIREQYEKQIWEEQCATKPEKSGQP